MSIEKFAEKIRDMIKEEVGESVEIEAGVVAKNNQVEYHNLTIKRKGRSIGVNVYLEAFFCAYCNKQKSLKDIVREIIAIENNARVENNILEWYTDFEKVKDKIGYKLVNAEKNKELLLSVPHEKFLDLVKVYIVETEVEKGKKGTIMIYNNHLDMWGVTESELRVIAEKNMESNVPGRILPMEEMILNIVRKSNMDFKTELETEEAIEEMFGKAEIHMYIATNKENIYGAATMCYGDLIKEFAHKIKSDLYILPSSVHETILVPARESKMWQAEELKEMVKEINDMEVPEEEILSNNVYYYDRAGDKITLL